MKLIRTENGKINLSKSLQTLQAGDVITFKDSDVNIDYVRVLVSKLNRRNGWTTEVSNPRELKDKIVIRRTK